MTNKEDYYGKTEYSWDYKNRLIELKKFTVDGSRLTDIKYSYDSKDRRTSKIVHTWTPSQAGSDSSSDVIPVQTGIQTTTSYQYDDWSVLKETHQTPSGSYTIDYSYKDDDTPQALTLNNSTYYYLTDGHGDIREVTDKDGNTLVKYSYDAWGNIATVTPVKTGVQESDELAAKLSTINPYRYASYRYDSDTGLYYLRARYYDSITGRFLSKDPIIKQELQKQIEDIKKANPFVKNIADEILAGLKEEKQYAYTANNPINYVDPYGLHRMRDPRINKRKWKTIYYARDYVSQAEAYSNALTFLIPFFGAISLILSAFVPSPSKGDVVKVKWYKYKGKYRNYILKRYRYYSGGRKIHDHWWS